MLFKKFTSILTILASCSILAHAQEETVDTTKAEILDLFIFQALRAQQQSPYSFKTLDKKYIDKENTGQDLPYLFQFQPSIVTSSDAGHGIGYTNMSIRGTDNSRINFTLNGVPINNPESQGTFLVNIPDMASSTNSIQIQRGVGSSTNGGGAFGGSVSINNLVNKEEAGGQIDGTIGSFNTYKLTVQGSTGRLKNGWAFDTRLSQITSDGYIDRGNSNLRALQILTSYNFSPKTKWSFNYMLGHEKTGQAWNGLSSEELVQNRRQNTLGLMPNGQFYKNQTDNYQQQFLQTYLDHQFTNNLKAQVGLFYIKGLGYYEEYRQDEQYSTYGLSPVISGSDTLSQTDIIRQLWLENHYYGGVYNLLYTKNNLDLTFGGMIAQYDGLHYGKVNWAQHGGIPNNHEWYNLPARKTEVNNYLKGQYKAGSKWIFTGELQHRFVDYTMEGFRKNPEIKVHKTYNFLNPKIGLNYNFKAEENNNQSIYASYAVANKEPNRDDFEAGVNEIPKHETMNDIELGYQFHSKKFNFNANAYFMLYKNQLVLNGKINDVGAYTRVNVANSHRIGLELDANYKVLNNVTVSGNMTLSDNKIKDFTEYRDNWDTWDQEQLIYTNTNIAFSTSVIAALGIEWQPLANANIHKQHKNLSIALQWKYVGKQYLDNTSTVERSLDAYQFANININYSLPIKQKTEAFVGFSLQNLTNTLYSANGYTYAYTTEGKSMSSNYYFPQAGRYFMVRLGLRF